MTVRKFYFEDPKILGVKVQNTKCSLQDELEPGTCALQFCSRFTFHVISYDKHTYNRWIQNFHDRASLYVEWYRWMCALHLKCTFILVQGRKLWRSSVHKLKHNGKILILGLSGPLLWGISVSILHDNQCCKASRCHRTALGKQCNWNGCECHLGVAYGTQSADISDTFEIVLVGTWRWPSTAPRVEVKKKVELYPYFPPGLSWRGIG